MGPSSMSRISKALSSSKSKCKPMLSPSTSAGTETLNAPLARTFSPSHSSSPLSSDGSVAAKANSVRGKNPLSSPLPLLRRTKPDSLTSTMLAAMPGLKIQAMARPPTSGPTTMAAAQTTTSPTSGRLSSRASAARRAKTSASSKRKAFDKAFFSSSAALWCVSTGKKCPRLTTSARITSSSTSAQHCNQPVRKLASVGDISGKIGK
mmetsp:Transcript_66222/g.190343  ORF Transcript_66222/g.190343 Transcript_66222/m.190343 type:complete len:207 (+) Transcript_66222:458-1078(+)